MENQRQFASLDASDIGLHGSLTNRPATGSPVSNPVDLAQHFAVEKRVADIQKQNGTYTPRTTSAETAYQSEVKAATDAAFRQTVRQAKADQEIQAQREQAQRSELLKIKSPNNTPHPYETESDRNTARRLMGLSPVNEPPTTSATTESRQPVPSRGSPPPTPNGTSARASALVEPTATPAPAALREAIGNTLGGIGQTLPRSLPQAAGRLAVPAVGAGLTFAGALIAGQSVQQAATSAAVVTGASVVGGLIGTAVGVPPGLSSVGAYVIGTNEDGSERVLNQSFGSVEAGTEAKNLSNVSIVRVDGQQDYNPDVLQPTAPHDNAPYYVQPSPLNSDAVIPSGTPAAGKLLRS